MGFPARYIDVSSPWSVGNISLTIRYNILLCRFEYSLEMITVIYSYPYSFDSVDHIRVVGWVLDFSLRHALPYGALIRLLLHMVLFDTFEFFLTFLCTCPFLYGSRFHCYEHPPRWYGPVHELINFDFSFSFSLVLVRVRDTLCDIHMEFCFCSCSIFMSVLLFLDFSLFFVNYQIFLYLSVVWCSQSCHLFD